MTKQTLYKYRSLDGNNFKFFVDILLKKRLYAPSFDELNDPMEGFYHYRYETIHSILNTKEKIRLCSLSRVSNNQLMWSHYANGGRGVVIELSLCYSDEIKKVPVKYGDLPNVNVSQKDMKVEKARWVLSHKLEPWKYEEEERVFVLNPKCKYIGINIESIIIGKPKTKYGDFAIHDLMEMIRKIEPSINVLRY